MELVSKDDPSVIFPCSTRVGPRKVREGSRFLSGFLLYPQAQSMLLEKGYSHGLEMRNSVYSLFNKPLESSMLCSSCSNMQTCI